MIFLFFFIIRLDHIKSPLFVGKKPLNVCHFIFQPSNFTTSACVFKQYSLVEPTFEYYLSVILLYVFSAMLLSITVTLWCSTMLSKAVSSHCYRDPTVRCTALYLSILLWRDYRFPVLTIENKVAMKIFVHVF